MLKKWLLKIQQKRKAKEQLKQAKMYYKYLQTGALFFQFIYNDIEKMKKNHMNRPQRRRFEKQLSKRGKLDKEMVDHYSKKIAEMSDYIEKQLNPPKKKKVKTIDGAKWYEELKKKEAQGKLKEEEKK